MAYSDHITQTRRPGTAGLRPGLRQCLSWLLETPFDRRYRARMQAIAALRAKSDAELAAMGLERSAIVGHVFGARQLH